MNTTFEDSVADATASLKRAQSTLISEIKNYPTPVAGCDVQYNHLLEERPASRLHYRRSAPRYLHQRRGN